LAAAIIPGSWSIDPSTVIILLAQHIENVVSGPAFIVGSLASPHRYAEFLEVVYLNLPI
jgi:hypothetical protein